MLARSFKRQAFVTSFCSRRCYTTREHSAASMRGLRTSVVGGGALTATLMLGWGYTLYADTPPLSREHEPAPTPLPQLLRSYAVYSMCSIPGLVDASPALLSFCTSVPGLRQLTEAFVRATFFTQVRSRAFDERLIEELSTTMLYAVRRWRHCSRVSTVDPHAARGGQGHTTRLQRGGR